MCVVYRRYSPLMYFGTTTLSLYFASSPIFFHFISTHLQSLSKLNVQGARLEDNIGRYIPRTPYLLSTLLLLLIFFVSLSLSLSPSPFLPYLLPSLTLPTKQPNTFFLYTEYIFLREKKTKSNRIEFTQEGKVQYFQKS